MKPGPALLASERKTAEVESRVVPQIVEALYPILYPVEQQDMAIQAEHHKRVTEVAILAWRHFSRRS